MKEFMLLIRNQMNRQNGWADEKEKSFLKSCETYIGKLKQNGNLLNAQPMIREGVLVSGSKNNWNEKPFNESTEVIVGYYHIQAEYLSQAVSLAKENPEFEFTSTARVEVRLIKTKEVTTGFVYPGNK